jgi:putative nucleotidyltransferase with HDIG domain
MSGAVQQKLELIDKELPESTNPPTQERETLLSIMGRANDIAAITDSVSVIQGMLDLMIEITGANSANFFEMDLATDELVFTSVRGEVEGQHLIGLRLNRQLVLPGISIQGSQPVVIGDLPGEPYWLRTIDPAGAGGKCNVIHLPVSKGEKTIGVIQIFNYQRPELDLLQVLGERLAVELDHRQHLESTQLSKQRLLTLVDVLGEVTGTLDRNHLLHLVTENASRLVEAERSSLFLVDPETSEMMFQVAYRSPEPDLLQPSSRIDSNATLSEPNTPPRDRPGQGLSNVQQGIDEFSYFNRSAITVPLCSEPLTPDQSLERKLVFGGLMALNKHNGSFQEEDAQLMQILANQASTLLHVAEMYESTGELMIGVIRALVASIDAKDPYTQGHSQRVSDYAVLISEEIGLDESLTNDIRIGSLLHDIGKIGIPDSILLKEGKLTDKEFEIIKQHPTTGMSILSQVEALKSMLPAISEHHERLDGSGYPAELDARNISLMGRIVAVADVFDAMTSDRPYRPAYSVSDVLLYLQENSGVLFDPTCVKALETTLIRSNEAKESNP